jgi:hypothetical protein
MGSRTSRQCWITSVDTLFHYILHKHNTTLKNYFEISLQYRFKVICNALQLDR